jgi:hypothetical protein
MTVSGSERSVVLAGVLGVPLVPKRRPLKSAAGVLERGDAIFFAFAPEFLLGGFEHGDALCDLFALPCEPLLLFGHAFPLIRVPASNGDADWGVNAEIALQDCGCPLARASSQASKTSAEVNEIEWLINEIERGNCWWWIRPATFLWRSDLAGS